jgi:hypothetical protein
VATAPRFVAATAVGLGLRLAFVALEPEARLVGDELTWTAWGQELVSPGVRFSPGATRLLFYPPVYPYFIAACLELFGSLLAVKLAQAGLGALLVPAVGRLGERLFGERAGRLAAWAAALYPDLVWFPAHFWSETVFLVLLFWGFERLLAAGGARSREAALLAGLSFGLASLTREPALYFVPLAALWLLGSPATRRQALAFGLAALAVVAPWTLRNLVVWDAFVPVSTFGPFNLWLGNTRMTRAEVYAEYAGVPGRIAKYRHTQRRALETIAGRQPLWIFEKLRDELPRFFEADAQALAHLRRGAYGPVSDAVLRLAAALFVLPYLAVLLAFVRGLARAPLGRGAWLLLAFAAYYVMLHVASHGFARFRLPVLPILLLFGAAGLVAGAAAVGARRRAAAAALGVALALAVAPSVRERIYERGVLDEAPGGDPSAP